MKIIFTLLIILLSSCARVDLTTPDVSLPEEINCTKWEGDSVSAVFTADTVTMIVSSTGYHWNKFKTNYDYHSTSGSVYFPLQKSQDGTPNITLGMMGHLLNQETMSLQIVEIIYNWNDPNKIKTKVDNTYILTKYSDHYAK